MRGLPTSDGAGVKLRRVIGQPQLPDLDPFLMLDEFGTDQPEDYLAGFPDHPHRGFETVTYMLDGRMRHRDNHGNEGVLVPGSVQWMTAGRGLVHSEMPEQQEGRMRGFQLWLNLPARDKMTAPKYQEFGPERIPSAAPAAGITAKVIAGNVAGISGPIQQPATDPTYLDLALEPQARCSSRRCRLITRRSCTSSRAALAVGTEAKPVAHARARRAQRRGADSPDAACAPEPTAERARDPGRRPAAA